MASSDHTLAQVLALRTRIGAANYIESFWRGWISDPMTAVSGHGWTEVTLACLAVESSAYFWDEPSGWSARGNWSDANGTAHGLVRRRSPFELASMASFCVMFEEIYAGEQPSGVSLKELAEQVFRVYRCGLAHRGLSHRGARGQYIGMIEGDPKMIRSVGCFSDPALSIDPGLFVRKLQDWFEVAIIGALRSGSNVRVDGAFKAWAEDRWGVPVASWAF